MFHKLRKKAVQVTSSAKKTVDPKFDAAHETFQKFCAQTDKVKTHISEYGSKMRGLCVASGGVVDVFADMGIEPGVPEAALFAEAKVRGDKLVMTHADALQQQLDNTCVKRMTELVVKINTVNERLATRKKNLEEMDYYTNKVAKLNEAKDKKGKAETEKDRERRERNEKKMTELQTAYADINKALTKDMTHIWDNRLGLLGPVLKDFIRVQQNFASVFSETVQDMPNMESGEGSHTRRVSAIVAGADHSRSASQAAGAGAAAEDKEDAGVSASLDDFLGGSIAEEQPDNAPHNDTVEEEPDSGAGDTPSYTYARALYELKTDDADNLTFDEGAIIEVHSELDWADASEAASQAWLSGRVLHTGNDREGQFPRNWVEQVSHEEAMAAGAAADKKKKVKKGGPPGANDKKKKKKKSKPDEIILVALYDLETDDPDNLAFEEGDLVRLTSTKAEWEDEETQWLNGVLLKDKSEGQFPKTYVELASQ